MKKIPNSQNLYVILKAMKRRDFMKKRIVYAVCGIVLIAAVSLLIIFAFSGDSTSQNITVGVEGTWRVVTYVNNGAATLIENEYMVFSDGEANAYRDGNKEPYASSNFTIDSSLIMNLPEISRKYTVDSRSKNHMRLYENADTYMYLIRYPNEDMSNIEIDPSIVAGRWDVVYRDSDTNYADEYLVFENGMMHDYHGENKEPTATMDYVWAENQIVISTINKSMTLHIISDTEIAFVETDTGYIWELKRGEKNN